MSDNSGTMMAITGLMVCCFCACVVSAIFGLYSTGKACEWFGILCTADAATVPAADGATTPAGAGGTSGGGGTTKCTSGELCKYTKKAKTNYTGGSLGAFVATKSVNDCAKKCTRNPQCKKFVVTAKKEANVYKCWLKSGGQAKADAKYTSYVKSTAGGVDFSLNSGPVITPGARVVLQYASANSCGGELYVDKSPDSTTSGTTYLPINPTDNYKWYLTVHTSGESSCDKNGYKDWANYGLWNSKGSNPQTDNKDKTWLLEATDKADEYRIMTLGRTGNCKSRYLFPDYPKGDEKKWCTTVRLGEETWGDGLRWKLVKNGSNYVLQHVDCTTRQSKAMYYTLCQTQRSGSTYSSDKKNQLTDDINKATQFAILTESDAIGLATTTGSTATTA